MSQSPAGSDAPSAQDAPSRTSREQAERYCQMLHRGVTDGGSGIRLSLSPSERSVFVDCLARQFDTVFAEAMHCQRLTPQLVAGSIMIRQGKMEDVVTGLEARSTEVWQKLNHLQEEVHRASAWRGRSQKLQAQNEMLSQCLLTILEIRREMMDAAIRGDGDAFDDAQDRMREAIARAENALLSNIAAEGHAAFFATDVFTGGGPQQAPTQDTTQDTTQP